MAEPQPPTIQEGAAAPTAPTPNAQDASSAKEVNGKALDQAMKSLIISDAKADEKKNVKVEPADVSLLVRELEVSRQRATELLRAFGGSAVEAMGAFVLGEV